MVTKKELVKAVRTQVESNSEITILSKTDEDVALDVLANGTLLIFNIRRCNVTIFTLLLDTLCTSYVQNIICTINII